MKNVAEAEIELGAAVRQFRIRNGFALETVADRAGISPTSVRSLELGRGSTVNTMLKVLKAIGELDRIDQWKAESESFSPAAVFKASQRREAQPRRPLRVSRSATAART
jgi:transcriptional regulator with XRE-family HTH domain